MEIEGNFLLEASYILSAGEEENDSDCNVLEDEEQPVQNEGKAIW